MRWLARAVLRRRKNGVWGRGEGVNSLLASACREWRYHEASRGAGGSRGARSITFPRDRGMRRWLNTTGRWWVTARVCHGLRVARTCRWSRGLAELRALRCTVWIGRLAAAQCRACGCLSRDAILASPMSAELSKRLVTNRLLARLDSTFVRPSHASESVRRASFGAQLFMDFGRRVEPHAASGEQEKSSDA